MHHVNTLIHEVAEHYLMKESYEHHICVFQICNIWVRQYTGCFTTLGHNCRRWFPRSLWSKKFILHRLREPYSRRGRVHLLAGVVFPLPPKVVRDLEGNAEMGWSYRTVYRRCGRLGKDGLTERNNFTGSRVRRVDLINIADYKWKAWHTKHKYNIINK
jgi:hypothetical protein